MLSTLFIRRASRRRVPTRLLAVVAVLAVLIAGAPGVPAAAQSGPSDTVDIGPDWQDWSWETTATPAVGHLAVQYDRQWAGLQLGHPTNTVDPATLTALIYGQSNLVVRCGAIGDEAGGIDVELVSTVRSGTTLEIDMSSCPSNTAMIAFQMASSSFDTLQFASAQVCEANGQCSDLVTGGVVEPPALPPFDCEADAGTLTWTNHNTSPYWTYKSTDGGNTFQWLGKTLGANTLTDPNATPGAIYQVHYQGIPRKICTNVGGSGAEAHLDAILDNPTRNTIFDDNPFRDVPMDQLQVSDLTVNADLYNEGLLDTSVSGYFRVKCEFSHFAYDDPIVFPNQPNRAHLHMFFGNTEANAYSTFDSLSNTGTGTCNGEDLNRTAYWVPALLDSSGHALIPFEMMVYYKNDLFRLNGANELVGPFPDNLRMVVGNAMATAPQTTLSGGPGSQPVVRFACGPAYNSQDSYGPLMPDCYGTGNGAYGPNGRALEMQIAFPQCYDPDSATYASDGSHMSYSEGGYYGVRCPDSHPYDVSSIMYRIFYSPDDYGGSLTDMHLSSDVKMDGQILPGGTTAHGDWFGAWHPETMARWVANCNNTQADCEIGLLDRDPFISLVPRKEYGTTSGYRAPPWEILEMCPTKTFDSSDPLRSVANCHTP